MTATQNLLTEGRTATNPDQSVELAEAKADSATPGNSRGPSKVQKLLRYAKDIGLFQTLDGEAFATLKRGRHSANVPVRTGAFSQALIYNYAQHEGVPPGITAVQEVQALLEARAIAEGTKHPLYLRVGGIDDKVYLDLCDETSRVVEITKDGWAIITDPPVKFWRPAGARPLPLPERGGKLHQDLLPLLNVQSAEDFMLIVGWLVAALRQKGPYPALIINGEHGSAKSSMAAMLRGLIDPNKSMLRGIPRDEADLPLAARNSWIVALDNVSHISDSVSDILCRIATGGAFVKRQLYTDLEEISYTVQRPTIINGIEECVTRGDLMDRSIIVALAEIPKAERKSEKAIAAQFESVHPRILGALLDAVVEALRREHGVTLKELPRMADFAIWVTAAEPALLFDTKKVNGKQFEWQKGAFLHTYFDRQASANTIVLEAVPWLDALKDLLACNKGPWVGSATELHAQLTARAGGATSLKTWPRFAKTLSGALRRTAPHLRTIGIDVVQARNSAGSLIRIGGL